MEVTTARESLARNDVAGEELAALFVQARKELYGRVISIRVVHQNGGIEQIAHSVRFL